MWNGIDKLLFLALLAILFLTCPFNTTPPLPKKNEPNKRGVNQKIIVFLRADLL